MRNELKIDGVCYKLCENDDIRESKFYVTKDDSNNILNFSLDCYFFANRDEEMSIEPSLSINYIDLSEKNIQDLSGFCYKVKTAEESYEREDTFYYCEHEPFKKYDLTIDSYNDKNAIISIIGEAITDGYSEPYETKQIELNCTLPVKISIQKQEQFRFNSKGKSGKKIFASNYDFVFYKDTLSLVKGKTKFREVNYNDIKKVLLNGSKLTIVCDNKNITIKNVSSDIYNKIKNIINK